MEVIFIIYQDFKEYDVCPQISNSDPSLLKEIIIFI